MENTNIDVLEKETVTSVNSVVALPVNFVSVGTVDRDSVQIYIKQDVYKRIEKFAKEDISKEVGSILLGEYIDSEDRKTVIISAYIEAKFTDASASTLTFTHETWDYVYKEKDKKYPDKAIVGWQHTHPGYGIFLSNYDIFIQENFFNLPWQIAYVVDPIADTRGFFEWKNGKVSKMEGFYVYDEIGRKITISEKAKPVKKNKSLSSIILLFLLLISVMISVSLGIERSNIIGKLNEMVVENEMLIRQSENNNEKSEDVVQSTESKSDDPAKDLNQDDIESFRVYVIQAGDTLAKICDKYELNYSENVQKIMKINSIKDADKIYAGQELYLPINK